MAEWRDAGVAGSSPEQGDHRGGGTTAVDQRRTSAQPQEGISPSHAGDRARERRAAVLDDRVASRAPQDEPPTTRLTTLPDGRTVEVSGDPEGARRFAHEQGDNCYGFEGTCGLVACADVLGQHGIRVSEDDVVQHAVEHGLCAVSHDPPSAGGSSLDSQVWLLSDFGVVARWDALTSLRGLATQVEERRGVIAHVNAGVLWDMPQFFGDGNANHAITVTGVARDPSTKNVDGFFVNDSGRWGGAGKFVDAPTMRAAWVEAGGGAVITDMPAHAGNSSLRENHHELRRR